MRELFAFSRSRFVLLFLSVLAFFSLPLSVIQVSAASLLSSRIALFTLMAAFLHNKNEIYM